MDEDEAYDVFVDGYLQAERGVAWCCYVVANPRYFHWWAGWLAYRRGEPWPSFQVWRITKGAA